MNGAQGKRGDVMFPGIGTVVNVCAIVVGSGIGAMLGHRLPDRVRETATDALGLGVLLIAAPAAMAVNDPALSDSVGHDAPVLIVLGSLVLGGLAGSLLTIEDRLERLGGWLRGHVGRAVRHDHRHRFIEGFVTASLVFCVGPLAILGSLSDGLGKGADQLILKATVDGFAAVAFAASLGVGVMASALAVLVVQGSLTMLGIVVGSFVPDASIAALTASGGLLLVGVALRLFHIKQVPVGDLLPALVVAPVLTLLVALAR